MLKRIVNQVCATILCLSDWLYHLRGRLAWQLISTVEVRRREDGTQYVTLNGVKPPSNYDAEKEG